MILLISAGSEFHSLPAGTENELNDKVVLQKGDSDEKNEGVVEKSEWC